MPDSCRARKERTALLCGLRPVVSAPIGSAFADLVFRRLLLDESSTIEALLISRRLSDAAALDSTKVDLALTEVIREWVRGVRAGEYN